MRDLVSPSRSSIISSHHKHDSVTRGWVHEHHGSLVDVSRPHIPGNLASIIEHLGLPALPYPQISGAMSAPILRLLALVLQALHLEVHGALSGSIFYLLVLAVQTWLQAGRIEDCLRHLRPPAISHGCSFVSFGDFAATSMLLGKL